MGRGVHIRGYAGARDRRLGQLWSLNTSPVGWIKGRKGALGESNLGGLRSRIWCVEFERPESREKEEKQTAALRMGHVFG